MKAFKTIKLKKNTINKIRGKVYESFREKNFNITKIKSSKRKYPDLRKNKNLCLWLENVFKPYIFKVFPKNYHNNLSLQFPMSIRVFFNTPTKKAVHDYSTNIIHSDIWSGAPNNIRNFIYYVKISNNSSFCKIFNSIKSIKKFKDYRGKYINSPLKEEELKEIKYNKKNGTLITFDPYCPHYTFFPNNCTNMRISLDFRVKSSSPYYENGKYISKRKFISKKIGQPGLGFYWSLSKKKFKNINEKIQEELIISKKISNKAFELRNEYIKNI